MGLVLDGCDCDDGDGGLPVLAGMHFAQHRAGRVSRVLLGRRWMLRFWFAVFLVPLEQAC
jgi:hypothetical protein